MKNYKSDCKAKIKAHHLSKKSIKIGRVFQK